MISSLLVEAALRSALLALAVWIGLRILGVRNVLAQKASWGLVLAGALVMPMVLPLAAHWNVLPANVRVVLPADPQTLLEELQARIQAKTSPEQKPTAVAGTAGGSAPQVEQQGLSESKPSAIPAAASNEPASSDAQAGEYKPRQLITENAYAVPSVVVTPRAAPSLSKILLLLYLAVAGIFLLRLVFGLFAALGLWRRAKPISCESLMTPATSVDLRCSAEVSSPVTICSAIVLPVDYITWDSEKLRVVLAHERSHIRQQDFYLQLLAGVYAAVVWFSPLGWWLKRKLSDLAEAISDHAGLEEAANPTSYAQILLEFAAAPRPTLIGVAMARSGSLSRRIERLLNDVSFRQAFAGSRRTLAAVLVVPVALFAATALVRVEAAGQQAQEPPAPAVAPIDGVVAPAPAAAAVAPRSGFSQPEAITDQPVLAAPAEVPSPAAQAGTPEGAELVAPAALRVLTITPKAPVGPSHLTILPAVPSKGALTLIAPKASNMPGTMIMVSPKAPAMALIGPHAAYGVGRGYGVGQSTTETGTSSYSNNGKHSGYHYSYSSNGESYAIISGDGSHLSGTGSFNSLSYASVDKAKKQAHGDFLWFTRDGKSYFVDDPSVVTQIEAMYKPMEELGKQQEVLGKQQEELGKQQEALGRQQEKASVPTPDMSKEIAEIDEAMAKLKANQGKAMNEEQFAELQSKLGDLQGKLGEIQGKIGSKQGEFGEQMGKLGSMQGELGEKQGRLGEEQGRIAQEADRKVKSIIDESLKNGKAHPVQ